MPKLVAGDSGSERMQKMLKRVADLNEDGVYALADGDSGDQAIELLLGAMRFLEAASRFSGTLAKCHAKADFASRETRMGKEQVARYTLPHSYARQEVPHLESAAGLFYTFSAAVSMNVKTILPLNRHPADPKAHEELAMDISFYYTVVSFNLALAHHQRGILGNLPSSLALAQGYYRQCQEGLLKLTTTLPGKRL